MVDASGVNWHLRLTWLCLLLGNPLVSNKPRTYRKGGLDGQT